MLVYNPGYDIYHCIYRIYNILYKVNPNRPLAKVKTASI
ncbi:ABC-three component system middle component 5 [Acinetobacter radioresistens]